MVVIAMIGIYKITNKLNNKIYIGQSNNIQRRFLEHQTKGSISRIPVDEAIQKYGKENFSFEVMFRLICSENFIFPLRYGRLSSSGE